MTYENFVQVQLAAPLGSSDTTLTLANPIGAYRLPPATGGILVLADSVGSPAFTEIVSYVSRSGNTLSGLTRGQEGTSARAWPAGTFCYQSLTAGDFANALGLKAPLASPTFTGNPTAPTPAADDNDTTIATTAFVRAAMALFGVGEAKSLVFVNLDTIHVSGFYSVDQCPGGPNGGQGNGMLLVTGSGYVSQQTYHPYGTSTTYVRSRLGDTWSAWSEVWHTGNLVKQASSTDTTAGAMMAVGAFGLGNPIRVHAELNVLDLNSLITPGTYWLDGGINWLNCPFDAGSLVVTGIGGFIQQEVMHYVSGFKYVRTMPGSGVWSAWQLQYKRDNIIGPVSQSGGAIIERGSNANGSYVRFADGTQICWTHISNVAANTAYGYVFRSASTVWTFPAAFSTFPVTQVCEQSGNGNTWGGLGNTATSNTLTSFSLFAALSGTAATIGVSAIGRWY
ncbi:pyocin knob domain-containing protein [Stutzerimonas stutzeri]|uniref:Pyocin knob domain-containing protein n=1 Tax=Stutzerimonas stutzeri TaxID=316 RepID=A0AA42PAM1_STUST|nr:pyocin knob domain-containing protein [Stutzerimonas stutzeri]MDH1236570.1 pyocin knob domain-containing protein [Stutzerimonas stutzeri]